MSLGNDANLTQGGTFNLAAAFADPDSGDTWTATVDYGDGTGSQSLSLNGKAIGLNHAYTANGTYNVVVTVNDGHSSGSDTLTVTVTGIVTNTAPTIALGDDLSSTGGSFTLVGAFTDPDADTWTATVNYGDGTGTQALIVNGKSFTLNHAYSANGTYDVVVTVHDGHAPGVSDTLVVTVTGIADNTAPTVSLGDDVTLSQNGILSLPSSFIDPDTVDSWAVYADYGDGSDEQQLTLDGKSFTLSHTYTANGVYSVLVTILDDYGGVAIDFLTVTVTGISSNTAPVLNLGDGSTIAEGSSLGVTASFADADDSTSWTATVDYGDGAGAVPLTLDGTGFNLAHTYLDDGSYVVIVSITDDGGAVGTASFTVTVNNVAPEIDAGGAGNVTVGQAFLRSGSFTDPGDDTWTATVNYGDGSDAQSLVLDGHQFTLEHVYAQPGAFIVTVTVADDGGERVKTFLVTVASPGPLLLPLNLTKSQAPTGLPAGTEISRVYTPSAQVNRTATFTLLNDAGGRFRLEGRVLRVANAALVRQAGTHIIRVRVTSTSGQSMEKNLTMQIVATTPTSTPTALPSTTRTDVLYRDPATGALVVGKSAGSGFVTTSYPGIFPTSAPWVDLRSGDFNGDGLTDVIARNAADGIWRLARNTGNGFAVQNWAQWSPGQGFADILVTDFNGDGRADVLGRNIGSGAWYCIFAAGSAGQTHQVGAWNPAVAYFDVRLADLDGDRRNDLIGRVGTTGSFVASFNRVTVLQNAAGYWASLPSLATFRHMNLTTAWLDVQVGDVNGDGRADVLGRWQKNGDWYVCLSMGAVAAPGARWGNWAPTLDWGHVRLADIDGNGAMDLVGQVMSTGAWFAGFSTGAQFVTQQVGATESGYAFADATVIVCDFNGDGRKDVLFRRTNGQVVVGVSTGRSLQFSVWATWPANLDQLLRGRFAI